MDDRILVATRKGLFTIKRDNGRWVIRDVALMGEHISMVLPDPRDGTIHAAMSMGHFGCKMRRSRDGGKTFTESPAPEYPPLAEGEEPVKDPMRGFEIPNALKLIWSLEIGDPRQPGTLWCGTAPGGLFRSDDGGDTWQIVRSLWDNPSRRKWFGGGYDYAGIHTICVDPTNTRRVYVAISTGGVWLTEDGGKSWQTRAKGLRNEYMPPDQAGDPDSQDVHRLALCAANPDVMWIQHHNGIFHSTDAGRNWREIENVKPSVFGFPVVAHPKDANTAWFVPAVKDEVRVPAHGKVVVNRTRDGCKSFQTLSKGLPQEHAYDLVYRHGLDIDATGNRLVMGSTTGSLWVSEDRGDSWQTVAEHLPPIYVVRFG